MVHISNKSFSLALVTSILMLAATPYGFADSAGVVFSSSPNFTEKTGEELYNNVCKACHMNKGQGAIGAGQYPALAKNKNLESSGYPVYVILHGLKAMPPVGEMMSDEQVAAVVNYIRTNFGNDYKEDPATAAEVADTR